MGPTLTATGQPKSLGALKTAGYSAMVLSEVFPPQNGGSGRWLWEIYHRQPSDSYLMAVGDSHGTDPRDTSYQQPIERLNLAMPFRGISSVIVCVTIGSKFALFAAWQFKKKSE